MEASRQRPTVRLAWVAWSVLLFAVLGFGVVSVSLTLHVRTLRAELTRNVNVLTALQDLPTDEARARQALDAIAPTLEGSPLARGLHLVRDTLGEPELHDVLGVYTREIRREDARLSEELGAAWDRAAILVFGSLGFAFVALGVGAAAVRGRDREVALGEALVRQEARAETAEVLRILNKELGVARDDALAAQRLKTRLLAVLGHELRTPLNAVRGYAELLLEDGHDDAARILDATRLLERRAGQILDLSDEASVVLPSEHIEVTTVIAPLVAGRNTAVSGSARVKVQKTRLARVLDELLSNAHKYGTHVKVLVYMDNRAAVIEVSDDGPGMSPDDLVHATEPFWQADMSPSRPHEGLGLGLAVAEHHIRKLGGTLTLASNSRKGITATVRLPPQGQA
ncbi:MAG: HAMP domain-containing sensor histidine kinase [Myxococcota bacterium]